MNKQTARAKDRESQKDFLLITPILRHGWINLLVSALKRVALASAVPLLFKEGV